MKTLRAHNALGTYIRTMALSRRHVDVGNTMQETGYLPYQREKSEDEV
jgi:hypothetical protein